jgi:uncharacterized protein YggL (DUF469 family)
VAAIRLRVAKGTTVHADESPAWNTLHDSFSMQRVNHQDGFSIDGACTNGAESYFSRLRRGELGHHHHIAGPYLLRYAQEVRVGTLIDVVFGKFFDGLPASASRAL